MNMLKILLAAIGAVLTIAGFYEMVVKERYVPYMSASLVYCDEKSTISQLQELGNLAFKNVGGLIFVDIDFIDTCEENQQKGDILFQKDEETGTQKLVSNKEEILFQVRPTEEYAPDLTIRAKRAELDGGAISRIQPGLTEYSGDRLVGLFFLRGNLDAGVYEVDLKPVGYSDTLQEKFLCSKALADVDGLQNTIKSYLDACILKIKRPDWFDRNAESDEGEAS